VHTGGTQLEEAERQADRSERGVEEGVRDHRVAGTSLVVCEGQSMSSLREGKTAKPKSLILLSSLHTLTEND